MADSHIGLPDPEGSGKKLDAEKVTRAGVDYYRERDTILVAANPIRDVVKSLSLAAGSSANLDSSIIDNLKTGKLIAVLVSSSAACKWVIKSRDNLVEVEFGTLFTSGLLDKSNDQFVPPDKNFCTLAGAGVDETFRVTVTNLDQENAADVYATIFWDEV